MAVTRQELLEMLYPAAAISNSPASLSIKDFAKQTGLNQTLSDYQDAYADAVLSGSNAGKEILAQGDKAFSSQWYEILQNALRAALASRATGGELGTDFTDALSTTLAAMQEASAGATTQQNAYVNLANQIATAMAEAGVNGMTAFQQQGANLAQSYPALMESLAMQDSNLLAQLLGLLNEPTPGASYTGGSFNPSMFTDSGPVQTGTPTPTNLGATIFQPLGSGVAGPVQVTSGNPFNISNPSIRPDKAVLDRLAQEQFRNQIAAEDGLAWLDRYAATQQAAQSQIGQLLSSVFKGLQTPDPQINRATTRLPISDYATGVTTKPAYANLGLFSKPDLASQAIAQADADALARMYEDQLLSKDYRKAQVEQAKAVQNAAYAARPNMQPQTDAQWAAALSQNRLSPYSELLNNLGSQSPLAATPVNETEEERKRRIEKIYNNRGLATQIAAARANAAKQNAAQQAAAIAQAIRPTTTGSSGSSRNASTGATIAQAIRPTTTGSSGSSRNASTGATIAPIVSALNKAAAASGSSRSSGSRSSGGSGSSTRVSATAPSLSAANKAATALAKKKGTSSGLPGSNFSVAPKVPSLSNMISNLFKNSGSSGGIAGYSSSDLARRKALAKQGEME